MYYIIASIAILRLGIETNEQTYHKNDWCLCGYTLRRKCN